MEEVYLLWFLSISMLVCSFLSGLVPMALKLSDSKSRLLALLGSGILVGTALAIIIPEGIDALYGQSNQVHVQASTFKPEVAAHHDGVEMEPSTPATKHIHSMQAVLQSNSKNNMTWTIGMSLVVGFVLMLLIDQFSIYQGGGHHHHHHHHNNHLPAEVHTIPLRSDYTLANQDDDTDIGLEEDDNRAIIGDNNDTTASETKSMRDPDSHKIAMRLAPSAPMESGNNNSSPNNNTSLNRYYDHSRHFINPRIKNTKVTPTLGLVIHAAADGIALGAAATTSHRDVEMIIFLAIMLHKAPAAFSLVVLLIHNGLRPSTVRRHLLAFSLSAPIAAVLTYYGLSQSGKEALRRNNATGIAMLFSAGTFLFVATVHVLPELIQNKLLAPKEMFFLLGGAFLPIVLAQSI